jgi:hypothetical protein
MCDFSLLFIIRSSVLYSTKILLEQIYLWPELNAFGKWNGTSFDDVEKVINLRLV